MVALPKYPDQGEPIKASWGRAVVDYLRSITPRSVGSDPKVRVRIGSGGTNYDVTIPKPPPVPPKPLSLFDATTVDDGPQVGIVVGTLGGQLADEFPDPTTNAKISVGEGGMIAAKLQIGDGGTIDDTSIYDLGGDPLPDPDDTFVYIAIGGYTPQTRDDGSQYVTVASYLSGSQNLAVAKDILGNWVPEWTLA